MTRMRTYAGGCHCGKVRYDVAASLQPVRCLDGVDVAALTLTPHDGRSR